MSDIIFTLLLFFILTQNFLTSLAIDLPVIHSDDAVPADTCRIIEITASNSLRIGKQELSAMGWKQALKNHLVGFATETIILVKADRCSHAGVAIELIDFLRASGIRRVAISARRAVTESSSGS